MRQAADSWTRPNLLTFTIGVATTLFLFACAAMVVPFLATMTWSIALAVVVQPVYRRLAAPRYPALSAAVGVLAVAILVAGPALLLGFYLVKQARTALEMVQKMDTAGEWRRLLEQQPTLSRWVGWLQDQIDLQGQFQAAVEALGKMLPAMVGGSLWIVAELLITLYVLFYFLRDGPSIVKWLRKHSPFSEKETTFVFDRVRDCLDATVLVHLLIALLQGALGGLMMGILGLPFPVLWGAVMAVFSLIPALGAPVVWIPAALVLVAQGSMVKAVILAVWGSVVIGLMDNVLYPILVGRKVTLHTVPILFSYLGGLMLFGFSGLVLGPLIVTLTWTFLEIWRQRTAQGKDATETIAADVSS